MIDDAPVGHVTVTSEHGVSLRGVVKRFGSHRPWTGSTSTSRAAVLHDARTLGSGKTTLLRLIAGFERPDEGTISLRGSDVTGLPPNQRGVNTVFQDYALFPHFTVADNVAYGMRVRRIPRAERAKRVEAALDMVQMTELGHRKPSQLSGGQRQRVALARAIVNGARGASPGQAARGPRPQARQEMQVKLNASSARSASRRIYVTHDQEEALTMSDRVAVFRDGRIEQLGPPAQVYETPATEFVASFVGTSNVIETPHGRAVLRPEKVELTEGAVPAGAPARWARSVDVAYLGMVTRFTVELPTARRSPRCARTGRAVRGRWRRQPDDSAVAVSWSLDDAFPLEDTSDPEVQVGPTDKGAQ